MINALTGKPYSDATAEAMSSTPFKDPRWLTEKQAIELGGYAKCPFPGDFKSRFESFRGIRRSSGIYSAQMPHALEVTIKIPIEKNGETKMMRRKLKYYNIEQTYGAREKSLGDGGGTVSKDGE